MLTKNYFSPTPRFLHVDNSKSKLYFVNSYQIFPEILSEDRQPDEDELCFIAEGRIVVANEVGVAYRFGSAGTVRYLVTLK
jgi:hypothetical protein